MPDRSAKPQGRQLAGRAGYEKRDANAKWIFAVVGILFVIGMIMHFALAGVMKRFETRPDPQDALSGIRQIAGTSAKNYPRLQLAPPEDLKRFRVNEDAELNTYGWIDRTAGVVRIPIERAMELVLQRGLPTRTGTNGDQTGPSNLELQQQRVQGFAPENEGAK